jgi:hypothetical protein
MISQRTLAALSLAGATVLFTGCSQSSLSSASQGLLLPRSIAGSSLLRSSTGISPVESRRTWLSPEAKHGKGLLYVLQQFGVGSGGAGVYVFKQGGHNQSPIGYITFTGDGYSSAYLVGLAVDSSGTLYVGDEDNGTVLEYPKNQTKPSKVLTGAPDPTNVIVDRKGNVYAASVLGKDEGSIEEYLNGSTTPSLTICCGSGGFPQGMAVDAKDNLYVAWGYTVFRFAPGSSQGTNLFLENPSPPGQFSALTLGYNHHLYVAVPLKQAIYEYVLPGTQIYQTIGNGTLQGPYAMGMNARASRLWVGDRYGGGMWAAYGFDSHDGILMDTLNIQPEALGIGGIAAYPPVYSQ